MISVSMYVYSQHSLKDNDSCVNVDQSIVFVQSSLLIYNNFDFISS